MKKNDIDKKNVKNIMFFLLFVYFIFLYTIQNNSFSFVFRDSQYANEIVFRFVDDDLVKKLFINIHMLFIATLAYFKLNVAMRKPFEQIEKNLNLSILLIIYPCYHFFYFYLSLKTLLYTKIVYDLYYFNDHFIWDFSKNFFKFLLEFSAFFLKNKLLTQIHFFFFILFFFYFFFINRKDLYFLKLNLISIFFSYSVFFSNLSANYAVIIIDLTILFYLFYLIFLFLLIHFVVVFVFILFYYHRDNHDRYFFLNYSIFLLDTFFYNSRNNDTNNDDSFLIFYYFFLIILFYFFL